MTNQQAQEYRSFIRGAATYILLKQENPPMDARKIADLYAVDLEKVNAEINRIVETEQHKVGGAFEIIARPAAQTE